MTRHLLGLFHGVPGARAFRRHLATEAVKPGADVAHVLQRRWRWCWTSLRHRRKPPPPDPGGSLGPSCLRDIVGERICCSACRSASSCCLPASIIVAGVVTGMLAGPVRHRRWRADRAGALRGVSACSACRRRCACSSASARRWRSSFRPMCAPIWCTGTTGAVLMDVVRAMGHPGGDRGRGRARRSRPFASAAVLQVRASSPWRRHRGQDLSGRDDWRIADELPGRVADGGLWLLSRSFGLADGSQRRLDLQHDPDAVRQADPATRSRPRPASACRSPLRAPSATCSPGWPHQALLPPLSIGFVSLIGFALMAPVVELHGALRCAAGARDCRGDTLEIAFGCFLLLVSYALCRQACL